MPRRHHQTLMRTYIEPAPTQEKAAEALDLPFNTCRHRLAQGQARVAPWLWRTAPLFVAEVVVQWRRSVPAAAAVRTIAAEGAR